MSMLNICKLNFSYGNNQILKDINFSCTKGEISVFLGRSGVGKTTFLKIIAGLEHPTQGEIVKDGKKLNSPNHFVRPNNRNIGVVFQEDSLFHHLTVEDNIKLARKKPAPKELEDLLDLFKIGNKRYSYPSELSGGQKQRVAIARAMYQRPDIILFDEPFSALDQNLRIQLRQKVRNWLRENQISGIFITHDKEEAIHLADRLFILDQGRIVAEGHPEDVLENPPNQSVATFLESGILFSKKECLQLNKNLSTNNLYESQKLFIPYKYLELNINETTGLHCIITDVRVSLKLDKQVYISIPGKDQQYGPFPADQIMDISINDVAHLCLKKTSNTFLSLS
jgi:iron(III) transport system ATP-binding protein